MFASALNILDKCAPAKSKLLSARPEVERETFLSAEGFDAELAAAQKIVELEQKLRSMSSEASRLNAVIESMTPWMSL